MKTKTHLITIDPQIDFCCPNGSLYVPGADKDMERLTKLINRTGDKIEQIHVTLDSHHLLDIAHPIFWKDSNGKNPAPFTIISADDVKNGKYQTTHPAMLQRATKYVNTLATNGRYPLCIWPPHCLIGSEGYAIYPELFKAFLGWEESRFKMLDLVTKGSNFWTEHYSAVKADVPDPEDSSTLINSPLIKILKTADIIVIAGEALSHCVANTIRDIADEFGPEQCKKFVLLEDCCSNVPGFEHFGEAFVRDMSSIGMQVVKSTDFSA